MKKLWVVMIAALMCISMNCNCYAAEDFNGDMTIEEGANEFIEEVEADSSENISTMSYDEGYYKTLAVTYYEQTNSYYCGPATVKQVIQYLKGSSSTQTKYAEELGTTTDGTDMTKIAGVLNTHTSKGYVMQSIGSKATWMSRIEADTKSSIPVVLDINTTKVSSWPYSTSGHFVNTSGFDSKTGGGVKIRITDPYSKGLGNKWYSATDLYTANNNHFRQAMIWVKK